MRRESGTLFDGMWVLPEVDGGRLPVAGQAVGDFRHTITNRRITFEVFKTVNRQPATGHFRWIDPTALANIPHPSYVRKALVIAGVET
jgi:adenine-specific DNA glycosylase